MMGCDQEAGVPSYILLHAPKVVTTPGQGTDYQLFSEHYVFHNRSLLGAYSFEHEIPVLTEGIDYLALFAGIRANGIRDLPQINFFFAPDTMTRSFVPGEVHEYTPTYRYSDGVVFHMIADFESGNPFTVDVDLDSETSLIPMEGMGFDGSRGGVVQLTQDHPEGTIATSEQFVDFVPGTSVMMELTYTTTVDLYIALIASTPSAGEAEYVIVSGLRPYEGWNKVYIELSDYIEDSRHEHFQLMFSGILPTDGEETGQYIIDDVKLLSLQ